MMSMVVASGLRPGSEKSRVVDIALFGSKANEKGEGRRGRHSRSEKDKRAR